MLPLTSCELPCGIYKRFTKYHGQNLPQHLGGSGLCHCLFWSLSLGCCAKFMAAKGQKQQVKQSFACCSSKSDIAVYLREYNSNFNYVFKKTYITVMNSGCPETYQPCAKCSFDSLSLCCGLNSAIFMHIWLHLCIFGWRVSGTRRESF